MIGKKKAPRSTILITVLFSGVLGQTTAASVANEEIGYLLGHLERSRCVVYRNGRWYNASEARAHLEKKYRDILDRGLVTTTEDFINRAATVSSMSGKPYQVKCDAREQISSAEWLTTELQQLRKAPVATEP